MFSRITAILALAAALGIAACNTSNAPVFRSPGTLYYGYFNSTPKPQFAIVGLPLTNASMPTQVSASASNNMNSGVPLAIDSAGRLWVITFASGCCSGTNVAMVFSLPVTSSSAPLFSLTLSGATEVLDMAFDAGGNLWVASRSNGKVLEYLGPFTTNATLTPHTILTNGLIAPNNVKFDAAGHLYVANSNSPGTNSVAVFANPTVNTETSQLDGITQAVGLAFDAAGDLYVGSSGPVSAPGPLYRYNSNNLGNHATPDITDSTGILNNSFASSLAFDAFGNLYDTDCGSPARIYMWPLATQPFSSSLAPSAYSDATINTANCTWGAVIRF